MKRPPLPSYKDYREKYINNGLELPLKSLKFNETGILNSLDKNLKKSGWPWNDEVNPSLYNQNIKWPKITVVSPSYNQGIYLEETIRSVLLQNYPNIEYIVMDGNSNDNSVDVLKKYDPWLSYWESEKDRGQSHAINKGFSLASGDIYCWLNSDDLFTKEALYKVALAFVNSNTEFVYGNCLDLKDGIYSPNIAPIVVDRYLPIPGIPQPSTFWSKNIHQPIWEELHCTLDFELWMRIAKGAKKKYINAFLSIARAHEAAKTHSSNEATKALWKADHSKQWAIHGPINWDRLNKENRYFQKIFRMFPVLKRFF